MKSQYKILILIVGIVLSQTSYGVNVIPDINEGILVGISNIDINGISYDASFNNTFIEANSQFNSESFATIASLELKELFPVLPELSPFLSNPLSISGCDIGNLQTSCLLFTVVTIDQEGRLGGNGAWVLSDNNTSISTLTAGPKGGNSQNVTYVNWTVTTVPAPTAIFLFIPALLGLIGFRRNSTVGSISVA